LIKLPSTQMYSSALFAAVLFVLSASVFAQVPATGSSFCIYYAGKVTGGDQVALINATINAAIAGLTTDPRTLNWFNGVNNDAGKNFSAPAHAADLVTLHDHLVGFFGGALGCNASAFSTSNSNSGPFNPMLVGNLVTIHAAKTGSAASGFVKAVTATAFDSFNEIVTGFLSGAGVAPADLVGVSGTLTGVFRTTTIGSTTPLCQDTTTCDSSFEVALTAKGFTPSKIVVDPINNAVTLTVKAGTHNVVQASSLANAISCVGNSGAPVLTTVPSSALSVGDNYFVDTTTCVANNTAVGAPSGYLVVTVQAAATTAPPTSNPTGSPGTTTPTTGTSSPTSSATSLEFALITFVVALVILVL